MLLPVWRELVHQCNKADRVFDWHSASGRHTIERIASVVSMRAIWEQRREQAHRNRCFVGLEQERRRDNGWLRGGIRLLANDFNLFVFAPDRGKDRSEERRVGKECRSRWPPYP